MRASTVFDSRERDATALGEDIHVRNYDLDAEHVVHLRVVDDGETAFEYSYRLAPGATASEQDVLSPGEYDVEVGLDGLRRWVEHCRVEEGAARGILVETGNGTVSITDRRGQS